MKKKNYLNVESAFGTDAFRNDCQIFLPGVNKSISLIVSNLLLTKTVLEKKLHKHCYEDGCFLS